VSMSSKFNIVEPQAVPVNREGTKGRRRARHLSERRYCRFRIQPLIVALICAGVGVFGSAESLRTPQRAAAQTQSAASRNNETSPTVVIGFLGGFVHNDDRRHAEVQLAQRLRAVYGNSVQVEIFENRRRVEARKLILDWWYREGHGTFTRAGASGAHVILFGHSWGASAVVSLARELQRNGVPVSLTVQVDSVSKNGEDDSLIPANVVEAVNFYQTGSLLHGRPKIRAADPSRTRILGNLRFQYQKQPAECRAYPWYDRLLFKGHTAIECDPRVWSQVEALIRMRLPAALSQPAHTQFAAMPGDSLPGVTTEERVNDADNERILWHW